MSVDRWHNVYGMSYKVAHWNQRWLKSWFNTEAVRWCNLRECQAFKHVHDSHNKLENPKSLRASKWGLKKKQPLALLLTPYIPPDSMTSHGTTTSPDLSRWHHNLVWCIKMYMATHLVTIVQNLMGIELKNDTLWNLAPNNCPCLNQPCDILPHFVCCWPWLCFIP